MRVIFSVEARALDTIKQGEDQFRQAEDYHRKHGRADISDAIKQAAEARLSL